MCGLRVKDVDSLAQDNWLVKWTQSTQKWREFTKLLAIIQWRIAQALDYRLRIEDSEKSNDLVSIWHSLTIKLSRIKSISWAKTWLADFRELKLD